MQRPRPTNQKNSYLWQPGSTSVYFTGNSSTPHYKQVSRCFTVRLSRFTLNMPGSDKEADLTERTEAFLSELKRGGGGTGPLRGSSETARETTALLRRITAQARWSSAGDILLCLRIKSSSKHNSSV